MGLSKSALIGLKEFSPSSIYRNDLDFFETLRYSTNDLRKNDSIEKKEFFQRFLERTESVKPKKLVPSQKSKQKKLLEDFCKTLDKTLMIKNEDLEITEVKWERIDEFCNLLRKIERSDDRKIRWALYYLWRAGKTKISIKDISNVLIDFKNKNLPKIIKKILKHETQSGFVAEFDEKTLVIKHDIQDKLVWHYLGDEIGESSRRSPGEIEKDILELIDEGSYSASETSDILKIDEATISRTLKKLRKNEIIVLSSFGERGARYFTTNCDNCPFGTTKAACRKDALSYIIDYFKTCFDVDLTSPDFEEIKENQALLKIKRIVSMAKKEKNTQLERSISSGLAELFGTAVDNSLTLKSKSAKNPEDVNLTVDNTLVKLPVLFHLGLYKGAQSSYEHVNEIMKNMNGISKSDRLKIKKLVEEHPKKFLGFARVEGKF